MSDIGPARFKNRVRRAPGESVKQAARVAVEAGDELAKRWLANKKGPKKLLKGGKKVIAAAALAPQKGKRK